MSWGLYAGVAAGFFCIVYLFAVNGRLNENKTNKTINAEWLTHPPSSVISRHSRFPLVTVRRFDIHAKPVRWLGFSVDCNSTGRLILITASR
jgi:hypothetical protein